MRTHLKRHVYIKRQDIASSTIQIQTHAQTRRHWHAHTRAQTLAHTYAHTHDFSVLFEDQDRLTCARTHPASRRQSSITYTNVHTRAHMHRVCLDFFGVFRQVEVISRVQTHIKLRDIMVSRSQAGRAHTGDDQSLSRFASCQSVPDRKGSYSNELRSFEHQVSHWS